MKDKQRSPMSKLLVEIEVALLEAEKRSERLREENERLREALHSIDKEIMLSIIKAVAHIGVDFGYGEYELEQEHIAMARAILEENNDE